jgi:two-component system sensor histidine kinase ChvG
LLGHHAPGLRRETPKAGGEAALLVLQRSELVRAFAGSRATMTRVARNPSAVFLFLAEPVRQQGKVPAVVYVTRSTTPVLLELHRIRSGLAVVLAVGLALAAALTLALAFSISRPLERLSRAARRITRGESGVTIPRGGGGEISELAQAFSEMTERLDARHRYISEFAADVAHAFKSPLTSIRGAAELLTEGASDDPAARLRFLDNIGLDVRRLDRLVTRLLELSRIDASDAEPSAVALPALLRRVARRAEGPDNAIVVEYDSEVSLIEAREADLETALANLLDNALRFSPAGAAVRLQVTGTAGEPLAIRVEDQGPGIPAEHQARLFERFFTTDAEGTGLGLAIVKSVAEAHGGSVEVDSEVGRGSAFVLRLPPSRALPTARARTGDTA